MLLHRLASILSLAGLLFVATTAQGAKQLCEEAPNFENVVHQQLKNIEIAFQEAKLKAENLIANMKKAGSTNLEELEKETHNFESNYKVMLQLMEQKPSFCERLIHELDESIKFFANSILTQFHQTTTTKP